MNYKCGLKSHSKIYRRNIIVSQTAAVSNTTIGHLGFMPNSVKMSKHLFFNSRIEVSILKNVCFDISLIIIRIFKDGFINDLSIKIFGSHLGIMEIIKISTVMSAQPNSKLVLKTKST